VTPAKRLVQNTSRSATVPNANRYCLWFGAGPHVLQAIFNYWLFALAFLFKTCGYAKAS
jgi:hypothetical protein